MKMIAKFNSRCPACLAGIVAGQEVSKLIGRWVHSACVPAEGEDFEMPENWKWRGTRQMAGGRLNTRSRAGSTRGIHRIS